jgi:hypothetical protein
MSTAMSSHILIIDLGANDEKIRILRRFDHHRIRNTIVHDRVVKRQKPVADIEMEELDASTRDNEDEGEMETTPVVVNVLRIGISADGQWLATSDDRCQTHIFNLDSVQVWSPVLRLLNYFDIFMHTIASLRVAFFSSSRTGALF